MKLSEYFNSTQLINDCDIKITHYYNSKIDETVTFAENLYYLKQAIKNPNVAGVITTPELFEKIETKKGLVISNSPKKTFFHLHNEIFDKGFYNSVSKSKISPKAIISPTAVIKNNVIIEDDVIIEDFVVIESNSILKKGSYIAAHSHIGARGMHNTFIGDEYIWVKDAGGVILEEGVQVLSNSCIQKSYFNELTRIGSKTIISVHCNIGHGSYINNNTLIAGNAQIAGYVNVGKNCWIGPSVCVAHGIVIGDFAEILIGSVVIGNIKEKEKVSGNFAISHKKNLKKTLRGL